MALWKIRPEAKNRTVGLRLLSELVQFLGTSDIGVIGINPLHPPMYKSLGFFVGKLNHHFTCNLELPQTLILSSDDFKMPQPMLGRATFVAVNSTYLETSDLVGVKVPHKTPIYFLNRYLNHPFYLYSVFVIELDDHPRALVATRIAFSGEAKVLRIVDFLGDEAALAESGSAIRRLLCEKGCEYADIFEYGLAPLTLSACGFKQAIYGGDIVVPNYFEPFLQRSACIEFAFRGSRSKDLTIFRGDGDQDRPNLISIPYNSE